MKSIIKKSLEAVSIEALVSMRTYDLLDRIEFLEKEIYPKEKGYVRGVLAPTFTSKMENPPQPLPEVIRQKIFFFGIKNALLMKLMPYGLQRHSMKQ